MKTKFTVAEIKEYLEGWFICDGNGNIKEENGAKRSLSLESILILLDDDQDGIAEYFERKNERKIGE